MLVAMTNNTTTLKAQSFTIGIEAYEFTTAFVTDNNDGMKPVMKHKRSTPVAPLLLLLLPLLLLLLLLLHFCTLHRSGEVRS